MSDTENQQRDENDSSQDEDDRGEGSTMIAPKVKVIFVDDDKTPVDFVLFALETYLGYDEPDAQKVVQNIAEDGEAIVAELPAIPAQLAKKRIEEAAADAGWPFQVRIEGEQTL